MDGQFPYWALAGNQGMYYYVGVIIEYSLLTTTKFRV